MASGQLLAVFSIPTYVQIGAVRSTCGRVFGQLTRVMISDLKSCRKSRVTQSDVLDTKDHIIFCDLVRVRIRRDAFQEIYSSLLQPVPTKRVMCFVSFVILKR